MSVPDCFVKVAAFLKSIGRNVPEDVLRDMAITLSERQAEGLSPEEFNQAAKDLFIDRLSREAAQSRAAKLINLQKIENAKDVVRQDVAGMNSAQKMEAWILGNSRRIGNALNLSVPDMQKAMASQWLKGIRNVLKRGGDLEVAESGLLAREVTQELASLERGDKGSVSGNDQAYRIAKAYNGAMAASFEVKQAHDPFLGQIQDYFHRASHSQALVAAVDRAEWVQFAMDRYGEKSFPELVGAKKVEAFSNVYDQIVKGTYESQLNFDTKPGDIMSRMAGRRTLIPNDWEGFYDYNQRFGRDNVHTSVIRGLENAAYGVSVIKKFGSLPSETFNGVMSDLIKNGTPEEISSLKENKRRLEDYFKAATQRSSGVVDGKLAAWTRGFMGLQQLAKNSTALLRSWQDLANFTTTISDSTGGNYFSNFVDAASSYVKFFAKDKEARLRAAEDMYLFSRSALQNLYQEAGGQNSAAGGSMGQGKVATGLNTMLELQSKVSLMQRHITAVDAAMADVLSRRLGAMTELDHSSLPPEAIQGLRRYGIGEQEWNVLRQGTEDWSQAAGVEPAHGRMDRMLTSDGVRAIPDEVIAKYAKGAGIFKGDGEVPAAIVTRARTDLEVALGSMISQHADSASSSAGLAERAWMYRNVDPNSMGGAALRMIWQFKSAMVKNYDTMMRSYYSNPNSPQGDWTKVARHVLLGAGLWATGETAKTLFEGKTPEDPLQPSFIAKTLLSSGAGGIIGDAIISEVTRASKASDIALGALKGFAGPSVSTGVDVLGILGQLGHREMGERVNFPGKEIGNLVTQNLPFQNLFYTKAAFNYYFANGIREWMDPGYTGRLSRAVSRKPGLGGGNQQYFMFNPTE